MPDRPFDNRQRTTARQLLVGVVLALPAFAATAITLSQTEVDDPIALGQTCRVQNPASYGSYVYTWPSRFDFVFWPLSDPVFVRHCERSGFTALMDNFNGRSGAEITAIRDHLATHYDGVSDPVTRLRLLDELYRLRDKDPAFDNRLLRMLARRHQDLGLLERANDYRLPAFEQFKAFLETDLPDLPRLEHLYFAANCTRQFGDIAASDRYLEEFNSAIEGISNTELADHLEYLSALAGQTRLIQPGGRLDPVRP